jgi:hypothetical protein
MARREQLPGRKIWVPPIGHPDQGAGGGIRRGRGAGFTWDWTSRSSRTTRLSLSKSAVPGRDHECQESSQGIPRFWGSRSLRGEENCVGVDRRGQAASTPVGGLGVEELQFGEGERFILPPSPGGRLGIFLDPISEMGSGETVFAVTSPPSRAESWRRAHRPAPRGSCSRSDSSAPP